MANPEHLEILKQGVDDWNKWRDENPDVTPDLTGAELGHKNYHCIDFSNALLSHVNLSFANMTEAIFNGADLTDSNLSNSDCQYSDFSNAILAGAIILKSSLNYANMVKADLADANFCDANFSFVDLTLSKLYYADFSRAEFFDTRMTKATIGFTIFADVNLSGLLDVETINHIGPSSVSIDTFYRSKRIVPEVFLRGCGVPENFIQYMSSLTGKAFEYYSCFISYSSKDQDFAERLYANLQKQGVRCWFAPEDMKIGEKIRDRIDQSIRIHDKLLLILSEYSINSDWVEDEVETAYEQERKRDKTVLFPIRLDSAVMDTDKAWSSKLRRQRHIGDFTQWKDHDAYQKGLDRLMRDLKAEEPSGND